MTLLRKNLAYLIAKRETNPTALSTATKVPQPTIHRILSGESVDPRTATLAPLAEYFGLTIEALRSLDVEDYDVTREAVFPQVVADAALARDDGFEAAPTLRKFKSVPIVGTVEGGPDGYLEEFGHPVGHGDGMIDFPVKDQNAYALRVRGESMHPRIRSGEFIVVEPNRVVEPGDDVVVICRDGRKMVKQLLYQRDGEITLGSINSGYPPITLDIADVEGCHYVAGIMPRGAFMRGG